MNARLFPSPKPVTITREIWLGGDSNPPSLELSLSDGSFVQVRYDSQYNCRNLFRYADETEIGNTCIGEDTGLSPEVLADVVDRVADAVKAYDRETSDSYDFDGDVR